MTTAAAIIARIEAETRYQLDQAAREPYAEGTALAMWETLFSEGRYAKAREWWFAAVEVATRER